MGRKKVESLLGEQQFFICRAYPVECEILRTVFNKLKKLRYKYVKEKNKC